MVDMEIIEGRTRDVLRMTAYSHQSLCAVWMSCPVFHGTLFTNMTLNGRNDSTITNLYYQTQAQMHKYMFYKETFVELTQNDRKNGFDKSDEKGRLPNVLFFPFFIFRLLIPQNSIKSL
jgi:hypothetical protein